MVEERGALSLSQPDSAPSGSSTHWSRVRTVKEAHMQFLLDQTNEHLDRGLTFQSTGDLVRARYHFLKAAEFLFKAARRTTGRLREKRIEHAEELLRKARELEATIVPAERGERTSRLRQPAGTDIGEAATWLVAERPRVRFDDVAGLEDVKEQIRLKLIYPFTHPRAAKRFGIKKGGGILLYGPPGTGKTLIARAVASEVGAVFFTVKPSEIMSKWVGEAERNIERLFTAAHSCDRAVIFIDEVEALIPRRRSSRSTVMQRVVPQILAELEGFEERTGTLLFLGATNEPWALDPAMLRPGRFDERIYVPLPDHQARRWILGLNLSDRPLADDVSLDELADMLEGYSGADIVHICGKACAIPFIETVQTGEERDVEMSDFMSVIHEVKPSVSPRELKRFEAFAFG